MMKKKIVSLLLVLVLLMGIIPTTALTASAAITIDYVASLTVDGVTENYTNLENAFLVASQATGDSVTLKLLRDVTMEEAIAVTQGKVTIDLNGKVWLKSGGTENLYVASGADVKITDTSSEGSGKIIGSGGDPYVRVAVVSGGKLEVAGGTIENYNVAAAITVGTSPGARDDAQLILSGGTVKAGTGDAIWAYGKSVTLKGGSVEGTISYAFGALTVEGDYTDLAIEFFCRESYPSEDDVITLPEGYVLYDGNGHVAESFELRTVYTVGAVQTAEPEYVASLTVDGVTENYTDLEEAFLAASQATGDSVTLKLLRDVTMEKMVFVTQGKFTIDLNGKVWSFNESGLRVSGSADLKIIDTSSDESGKLVSAVTPIMLWQDTKLEVASGTIEGGSSYAIEGTNNAYENSELIVSGGKVLSENGYLILARIKSVVLNAEALGTGKVVYREGVLTITGDPTGMNILFTNDSESFPDAENAIILPEGYVFYDGNDRVDEGFQYYYTYTVGAVLETPEITEIVIDKNSPAYDAESNTFKVSEDQPLVITIVGKNLTKFDSVSLILYNAHYSGSVETVTVLDDTTATFTVTESLLIDRIKLLEKQYPTATEVLGIGVVGNGGEDTAWVMLDVNIKTDTYPLPYTISVHTPAKGGTATSSLNVAYAGDTITLTVTPSENYVLDRVSVIDQNGDPIPVDENLSFVMPDSNVTVTVTFRVRDGFHEKDGYKIIWSETFDGESLPSNFTSIDADGDGYGWIGQEYTEDQGISYFHAHECSDGCAVGSPSYINELYQALRSDNRLVFPSFQLNKGNEYLLSFMIASQDKNHPDSYSVAISLDGGNTFVKTLETKEASGEWEEVVLDLSEYAGETVTVVVLHQSEDCFYLLLDCVYLYEKTSPIGEIYNELDALKAAVEALEDALADKVGAEELEEAIKELNKAIEDAKTAATDADTRQKLELLSEIEKAQNAAVEASKEALEEAKKELQAAIDKKADITALNAAIETLNDAIALAKTAAEEANSTLRTELLSEIEKAQKAAVDASAKALEEAKKELQAAIDKKADITALDQAIEDLTDAIALAKTAAEEANDTLRTELLSEIAKAQKAATDAAAEALAEARLALQDAIEKGDKANADALAEAVRSLNSAIELAKKTAADADAALKQDLEGQIGEARSDLENAINQVQKNLENAQSELESMIADGDRANAEALEDAIENLNASIEEAKKIAAESDDELRMLLLKAIANAKTGAIESANAALESARAELQAEIAKGDQASSDALKTAVEALEKAIALAEQTAKDQDADLSQRLEGKIEEAKKELLANLDSVKEELTAAIKKLQEADSKLNADLLNKEEALLDAIESLRAELESTKKNVPSIAAPLVIAIVALIAGVGAVVLIFIFRKKD